MGLRTQSRFESWLGEAVVMGIRAKAEMAMKKISLIENTKSML